MSGRNGRRVDGSVPRRRNGTQNAAPHATKHRGIRASQSQPIRCAAGSAALPCSAMPSRYGGRPATIARTTTPAVRRGTEPSTLRPFLPDIVESYLLAFRRRGLERPGLLLTIVAAAALLGIGFIFIAHAILMGRPDLWGPGADVAAGTVLPLGDSQLLPRL